MAKASVRVLYCTFLPTDDAKATFNQAALNIGIRTVEIFNKVLAEMTKHVFPAYAFRKQKRHLYRHLVKPRSMKLRSFISRLQELNAYLEEFPPDTEGQETVHLPADEIMDIFYLYMPTTSENKMIGQDFNYANFTVKKMADFFETRVEKLEPKEDKKSSAAAKKTKKATKRKRKGKDSDSSVVEFREESTETRCPSKKYCILHGKCSLSTDSYKDLRVMVNMHKQKKSKISGTME